jgi:hypothetical protein
MRRGIAVGAVIFLLAACSALPDKFSMYPEALRDGQSVNTEMAVLLIGNSGPASINYLQFDHSSLPAINARGIDLPPNGIVAVPVPVGLKDLSLEDYTISSRGAGYLPNGMAYGYIPVHTPRVDITTQGLYYIATIHAGSSEKYSTTPDPAILAQFRRTHPQFANLKPINFSWPG